MKTKSLIIVLAAFIGLSCAQAQTIIPLTATVNFANEDPSVEVRSGDDGCFPSVAAIASESLTIYLAFPVEMAGTTLVIVPMDGGTTGISSGTISVDQNGVAAIPFQVGTEPGLYRVFMNAGGVLAQLQFQVPQSDQ